ncbi:MAG: DNA primase [Planctomycetes bacterium]|jgi:DNA primase|nr:DNA primase [Planctomycetota bacterium]
MDRFEEAKLRIKEATDLVALIESYMPLKPRGRNLLALCPFHAENSPSFSVSRENQFYHCFGCGKTGDVFTWLMERDGLTFREAMEVLADRAGISLEGVWKGRNAEARKGPDPYQALAEVAGFLHRSLDSAEGELAYQYLDKRGLVPAIEPWRLGYHPQRGALSRFAQEQKLPRDVLEAAGLLRNGRELFAGRVMFPITDERGRTVGFGGRLIPGAPGSEGDGDYKPPKYLNSPESPFFNKRRVLFGLHQAKQAGQRRIVVMEGYTDVIACHLAGFTGAVASLGTAFTQDHAKMVERYATDGIVLMFDGDRAGVQAAERALRELVNSRLPVRIALMSDTGDGEGKQAKDPAEVVTAQPGEDPEIVTERRARFADILDAAEDSLSVWFRLMRRRLDLSQAVHLETAARECASVLGLVHEPVRQAAYMQEMARHLSVPAPTLERMLQKAQRAPARETRDAAGSAGGGAAGAANGGSQLPPAAPRRPLSLTERTEVELLACLLAKPLLLVDFDPDDGAPFEVAEVSTSIRMASDGVAIGRTLTGELMKYLFARAAELPGVQRVLAVAAERAATIVDADAVLAGLLEGRRRLSNEPRKRALRQQLQQAIGRGDKAAADELQQQLMACHRLDQPRGKTSLAATTSQNAAPNPFLPQSQQVASQPNSLQQEQPDVSLPSSPDRGSPDRGSSDLGSAASGSSASGSPEEGQGAPF